MPETNETHVVTDLPNKKSTLRDRLTKKQAENLDPNEPTAIKQKLSKAKKLGIAFVAGGITVAVASKLAERAADNVDSDVPTDAPTTDN